MQLQLQNPAQFGTAPAPGIAQPQTVAQNKVFASCVKPFLKTGKAAGAVDAPERLETGPVGPVKALARPLCAPYLPLSLRAMW